MPIQWKNPEVMERLVAAIIATMPNVDVKEIARLYGGEMTYNALEGRLRPIKKVAANMKEEAVGREAPAPSPARPRAMKPSTQGVKTGRVTKIKVTAKSPKTKIKSEPVIDLGDELEDNEQGSMSNIGSMDEEEENQFV